MRVSYSKTEAGVQAVGTGQWNSGTGTWDNNLAVVLPTNNNCVGAKTGKDTGLQHLILSNLDLKKDGAETGRISFRFQMMVQAAPVTQAGAGGFTILQWGVSGVNGTLTLSYVPVSNYGGEVPPHTLVASVAGDPNRTVTVALYECERFIQVYLEYDGTVLTLVAGQSADQYTAATSIPPATSPNTLKFAADIQNLYFMDLQIFNAALMEQVIPTATSFPYMLWDSADSGVIAAIPTATIPNDYFVFLDRGYTAGHKPAEFNLNTSATLQTVNMVINDRPVPLTGFAGTTSAALVDYLLTDNGGVKTFGFDGKTEAIHFTSSLDGFNNPSQSNDLTGWGWWASTTPAVNTVASVTKGAGNVNAHKVVHNGDVLLISPRIYVGPNDVLEVPMSIMVADNLAPGARYLGFYSYDDAGVLQTNDAHSVASRLKNYTSSNCYWFSGDPATTNTWVDVIGYVIGCNVDPATVALPNNLTATAFFKLPPTATFIRLRWLSYYNAGTSTTAYMWMGTIRNYCVRAAHRRDGVDGQMSFSLSFTGKTNTNADVTGGMWGKNSAVIGKIPQQWALPHTGEPNRGISILGGSNTMATPKSISVEYRDDHIRTAGKVIGDISNRPGAGLSLTRLEPTNFFGSSKAPFPKDSLVYGNPNELGYRMSDKQVYAYGLLWERYLSVQPDDVGMSQMPFNRSRAGDTIAAFSIDIPLGQTLRAVNINFTAAPPGLRGNAVTTSKFCYNWGEGARQFPFVLTGNSDYTCLFYPLIAVDSDATEWRTIPSIGTDAIKVQGSNVWKELVFRGTDFENLLDKNGLPLLMGSRRVHFKLVLAHELTHVTYQGMSYRIQDVPKK